MILKPGHIYKFEFSVGNVPEGSPVSPPSGVYRLLQLMTYQELLLIGVSDYARELFSTGEFMKLRSLETNNLFFVPISYLGSYPIVNVIEYPKLAIAVALGTVTNGNVLEDLMSDITGYLNTLEYAQFLAGWDFNYPPLELYVTGVADSPDLQVLGSPSLVSWETLITNGIVFNADDTVNGIPEDAVVSSISDEDKTITLDKNVTVDYIKNINIIGDHAAGVNILLMDSVAGIQAGDRVEPIAGIPVDTFVESVDTSLDQITISNVTTVAIDGSDVPVSLYVRTEILLKFFRQVQTYSISGTVQEASLPQTIDLGGAPDLSFMKTLVETDDITVAVDNAIEGVAVGTVVTAVDDVTKTLTLNKKLLTDITDVTGIIDVTVSEQKTYGVADCKLLAYDKVWLTEAEAITHAQTIHMTKTNPNIERILLRIENSRLKVRISALERALRASQLPTS